MRRSSEVVSIPLERVQLTYNQHSRLHPKITRRHSSIDSNALENMKFLARGLALQTFSNDLPEGTDFDLIRGVVGHQLRVLKKRLDLIPTAAALLRYYHDIKKREA